MVDILYKNKYMKTLTKRSFILLGAVLSVTTLRAQSVDEIVSKYVDALGGKDVINSVKSVVIESTVDVMGNEVPSTTYILNGKGFKTETDFNGTKIIQCITDHGGWAINPMAGQSTPTALSSDQVKASQAQLQIGGPLFDYVGKGNKVEFIGKDTADYKLQVTAGSLNVTYYINMKTYLVDKLINKISVNGQNIETTIAYSNYKKTDVGYLMAWSQELNTPQISLNISYKKVDVNKTIDPAIFEMPK